MNADLTYPEARRIKELPVRLQPREQFEQLGADGVSDTVLLAILLRSGLPGRNVLDLARDLLAQAGGSLQELARMPAEELAALPGIGRVKAQVIQAALELARRLAAESLPARAPVQTPAEACAILHPLSQGLEHEVFWVLLLDTRNRLQRAPLEVSRGILNASLVHPREVFRGAVRQGAAAVVLAHNHPSGDISPSAEDLRITRQLVEAGRIVDIPVLDHLILGSTAHPGAPDYLSLREQGLVTFED